MRRYIRPDNDLLRECLTRIEAEERRDRQLAQLRLNRALKDKKLLAELAKRGE